jgi:sulfhydrogenase subunit gamma (sulfur reductase)
VNPALLPVRVLATRAEGRYRLLTVDGPAGGRRPGQYAFLSARAGEPGNPYAFAGVAGRPEFLIRAEAGVADELIAAGEGTIYMSEPRGAGFAELAPAEAVLFAAGSGIAPIRAMIEHLAGTPAAMTLYYGEPRADAFAFRNQLAEVPRLRTVWVLSPDRVQVAAAADAAGWDPARTTVYVCGMPAMEQAIRELAAARGIPDGRVLTNL